MKTFTVNRCGVAIAVALSLTGLSAAAASATDVEDPTIEGITIHVDDYTLDGQFLGTTTIDVPVGADGIAHVEIPAPSRASGTGGVTNRTGVVTNGSGAVTYGSGNETIPAPAANSGCRAVWSETWYGSLWKYYHLKNSLTFCYNKTTKKVSGASPSWKIISHDGLSKIPQPATTNGYYNYNGRGANTGYRSLRTWTVSRDSYYYYPRADIYGHGDGTAYASWNTN